MAFPLWKLGMWNCLFPGSTGLPSCAVGGDQPIFVLCKHLVSSSLWVQMRVHHQHINVILQSAWYQSKRKKTLHCSTLLLWRRCLRSRMVMVPPSCFPSSSQTSLSIIERKAWKLVQHGAGEIATCFVDPQHLKKQISFLLRNNLCSSTGLALKLLHFFSRWGFLSMGHCFSGLPIFSAVSLWIVEDYCRTLVLCTFTEALLSLFMYFSIFQLW